MPPLKRHIKFIDDQSALNDFFADIGAAEIVYLDTEFKRVNTYRPQLCLVQIADERQIACIDTLVQLQVQELLSAPGTLKVLHAAKQDMETLLLSHGCLPEPILDTQIAAGLLGFPPQIGYANLVEELFGIKLAKSATRTDWARRPLSQEQLDYAAADVAYLPEMFEQLRSELEAAGRYAWALEDSAVLVDSGLYTSPPAEAWQRIGSLPYLPVPEQARGRRLAAWRERKAQDFNRPRQWILSDKALLQIAQTNPATLTALRDIDGVPPAVARKQGEAILAELRRADTDVADGRIDFARQKRRPAPDADRLKLLTELVQQRAGALNLAPELLATRRELGALIDGQRQGRALSGWRREAIGAQLLEALD